MCCERSGNRKFGRKWWRHSGKPRERWRIEWSDGGSSARFRSDCLRASRLNSRPERTTSCKKRSWRSSCRVRARRGNPVRRRHVEEVAAVGRRQAQGARFLRTCPRRAARHCGVRCRARLALFDRGSSLVQPNIEAAALDARTNDGEMHGDRGSTQSAFRDRLSFRNWMMEISWETEVWLADTPGHLVHFNGEQFFGAYATMMAAKKEADERRG